MVGATTEAKPSQIAKASPILWGLVNLPQKKDVWTPVKVLLG